MLAGRDAYLGIAAELRPLLDGVDGFLSIERFQSLSAPGKILSLSFWRDEAAVAAWRKLEAHRAAQAKGRGGVFRDYRLRIGPCRARLRHERTRPGAGGFARGERLGDHTSRKCVPSRRTRPSRSSLMRCASTERAAAGCRRLSTSAYIRETMSGIVTKPSLIAASTWFSRSTRCAR